jgi:uncharacterized protein (DUF2062 family)
MTGVNGDGIGKETAEFLAHHKPGQGLGAAAVLTVVSAIVFGVATWELIKGDLSTLWAELAAAIALVAFGVGIYGLLRMILAFIETASERRRQAREVTERRKGDRARKPPPA